jgi:hypothetical protein
MANHFNSSPSCCEKPIALDVHPISMAVIGCPDPLRVDLERQALAVFTASLQVKLIETLEIDGFFMFLPIFIHVSSHVH